MVVEISHPVIFAWQGPGLVRMVLNFSEAVTNLDSDKITSP
jgi:hypothetical protein